jgi:hypothetical protein
MPSPMFRPRMDPSSTRSVYISEEGGLQEANYATYNSGSFSFKATYLRNFYLKLSALRALWAVKRFAIFAFPSASVLSSEVHER